jgi:hypothetical protein
LAKLEFEQINTHVLEFLRSRPDLSAYYTSEPLLNIEAVEHNFQVKKTSVFGEAEIADDIQPEIIRQEADGQKTVSPGIPDVTRW